MWKTEKNSIEILVGNIEKQKGDVILIWTSPSLSVGDRNFFAIHKQAGPQLFESTFLLQNKLQPSDCFSTIAGMLNFSIALHAIKPELDFNMSFRNIFKTLETYKAQNICRTVYMNLPATKISLSNFFENFFLYESLIEDINFIFVFDTLDDALTTKRFLAKSKKAKEQKVSTIDKFLKGLVISILNGYKQKKLPQNSEGVETGRVPKS